MLRRLIAASATFFVGIALSSSALADDEIRVLKHTPKSEHIVIPHKVKQECGNLGYNLPASLAQNFKGVALVKDAKALKRKKGKYLEIEIIEVHAPSGGLFSGRKKMVVRGVLYENGKEVGDVTAQRSSMGSFSTCENLAKVEKVLGKDIGRWLHNPRPNTNL